MESFRRFEKIFCEGVSEEKRKRESSSSEIKRVLSLAFPRHGSSGSAPQTAMEYRLPTMEAWYSYDYEFMELE